VRASIRNADFGFLSRRLTVNLVPAESPGLLSRLLLKHDRSLMQRFDRLPGLSPVALVFSSRDYPAAGYDCERPRTTNRAPTSAA